MIAPNSPRPLSLAELEELVAAFLVHEAGQSSKAGAATLRNAARLVAAGNLLAFLRAECPLQLAALEEAPRPRRLDRGPGTDRGRP